jgi:hypothetical protein
VQDFQPWQFRGAKEKFYNLRFLFAYGRFSTKPQRLSTHPGLRRFVQPIHRRVTASRNFPVAGFRCVQQEKNLAEKEKLLHPTGPY